MTKLSEQETVIGKAADEDSWNVWSTDPRMIRWLNRHGERLQMTVIGSGSKGGPWLEVQIPADQVRILVSRTRKRTLEGHFKEAARESMRKAREIGRTRRAAALSKSRQEPDPQPTGTTPEPIENERRGLQFYEQETTVD